MIIGFTGTQKGMTKEQKGSFLQKLLLSDIRAFHHGACIGADEEAVWTVRYSDIFRRGRIEIVAHPCTLIEKTSNLALDLSDIIYDPEPPLVRNETITVVSDILYATPKGYFEEQRSGTWATVRYMLRHEKPVTIIRPDGTLRDSKSLH